jgi:DNA-binding LytR/AlgR family response regulator
MKVLIIEDEQRAIQKLTRLLEEVDSTIEIADVLQSVEKAINWFLRSPVPDLIFMDVQLEDGICFEIFEKCDIKTPVIFTTAYDEFTLQAFKVNSVDYLLKPIVFGELKNAIGKFKEFHSHKTDTGKLDSILNQLQPRTKKRFLIKIGEHYKSVPSSTIDCFYIKERYNFILTDSGKNYPLDYSLDTVEHLVDPGSFFRISRNFIVRFSAIQDIIAYSSNRLKIILTNWTEKDEILVSRERVAGFKAWMDR